MAMVGQPGGGPIKHLSGLGAVGGFARAFEPRSSTGAVRGSLSGVGPLWWGAPPGGGGGVRPRPPRRGDRSFLMFFFCRSGLRGTMCYRFCVLGLIISRLLAAVSRFLYWWLPLPLPTVIEYSLASRSLTGMCVWRRNQRSQFVVRQYEREEGFEASAQLRVSPQAVGVLVHVRQWRPGSGAS